MQISDVASDYHASVGSRQPSLLSLGFLLNSTTTALERAAEESRRWRGRSKAEPMVQARRGQLLVQVVGPC